MMQGMTPIHFGPEGRLLFGWIHHPAKAERGLGLVICNAFGYEAMCTYRTVRTLAELSAAAGIPTLRFDYDGTGDSAGLDTDADRLESWLSSIGHAVHTLRDRAHAESVCLAGIRLGSWLAVQAARRIPGVTALLAMAPIVSGRQYMRELRALALAGVQSPAPPGYEDIPGTEESAGYALTEPLRSAVSAVDLLKEPVPPIRHAFLLPRPDVQPSDAWQRQLVNAGVQVKSEPMQGYVEMMIDPHENVVPLASLQAAVTWLDSIAPGPLPNASSQPATSTETLNTPSACRVFTASGSGGEIPILETAVLIGPGSRLFGMLSEPEAGSPGTREVLLILNSGGQHHVGPARMYVRLARRLASLGITSLRVDLAGLGDSGSHVEETGNVVYSRFAAQDLSDILDALNQRFDAPVIHAVGLCSGAYHALKCAVRKPGLSKVFVINPLTFFWKDGMTLAIPEFQVTSEANRYRKTAMQWSAWMKILRGQVNVLEVSTIILRRVRALLGHQLREMARLCGLPLPDDLARELRTAVKQGAHLQFIFSATDPGLAMLNEQGGATVGRLIRQGYIEVTTVEGADHTFTPRWTQERLLDIVVSRMINTRKASDAH